MSSVANRIRHAGTLDNQDAVRDKIDLVDFKMVTFSLSGKDYGIDIMKVKEIARFVNFTYVPNTPGFVRGVYNLRGEIISIIDLRALFNLPFQQKASNEEESGLILRLDNNLIGVVVDKIDKVVGINSGNIQPPHPIFGDINIKYISGVVENDGRLYIILDVERVLGKSEEKETAATETFEKDAKPVPVKEDFAKHRDTVSRNEEEQYRDFIDESLQALVGFHVSTVNQVWFSQRYKEWNESRKGQQVQIRTMDDAKMFLETFYSPFSSQLWGGDYFQTVIEALPDTFGKMIQVWNPGCGRGYETYSLAVALRTKYPEAQIKIWASDKDLLNISGAPNLVFADREIPELYREHLVQGRNGMTFSPKIKDTILFEYHDVGNSHALPPMDLVFARDLVSFMGKEQQDKLFMEINDNLKKGGYIILGRNEIPPSGDGWSVKEVKHMFVGHKSS
jgi:purine-binding chemotaxis protein CheW